MKNKPVHIVVEYYIDGSLHALKEVRRLVYKDKSGLKARYAGKFKQVERKAGILIMKTHAKTIKLNQVHI